MGITIKSSGSFKRTESWLQKLLKSDISSTLENYGKQGVALLQSATPLDSGETANSWYYEVTKESNGWSINFKNDHVVDGANIAILLQYGHGTRTGGYVQGRDYINPVVLPLFEKIASDVWKAVTTK